MLLYVYRHYITQKPEHIPIWHDMYSHVENSSGFLLTIHLQVPIFGCSYVE